MSRIAGLVSGANAPPIESLLTDMVSGWLSDARWRSHHQISGKAAFSWCGWRAPNTARVGGLLAMFDGEIYNRGELGAAKTDAALFAELYNRYGFADALRKVNGDFSAAVYDPQIDALWLARDRFGVKPLYYVSDPDYFAFASQPHPLLGLPGISTEVNRKFVGLFAGSHYRYFDNDPEQSPYADIAQLPAASMLCFKGGELKKEIYWGLQDLPDFGEDEEQLAEQYRELLLDATSLRLSSAQRPAFTLSGGMDSSSVLASAVRITGSKQQAFSTVYADKTYDESDEIRSMLGTTVQDWHAIRIGTPNLFELVERMVEVHEEPVATATWLSHLLLSEETAERGFGTLFGGLGGDELNAGEYEHFFYHFADLRAAGNEEQLASEVRMWVQYHNHPIFQKSFSVVEDAFARLIDFTHPGRCLPDRNRMSRYAAALDRDYFNLEAFVPVMEHPFRSYLKNRTYQDLTRETIPCCLRAEDRQTVTFGLNNCLPFFDHRLAEFMFRIPGGMKFRDGVTKHLLRRAMHGVLPDETRTRVKKTGWNAPAHQWLSGAGHAQLLDLINSQAFRERGIYNVAEVLRLLAEHQKIVSEGLSRDNHMMFFWQLVNLELWLRWVDKLS